MMIRSRTTAFLLCFVVINISSQCLEAQTLYVPREVQKALNKKTRSLDGRPGPSYWQNRATYKIKVSVWPPNRNIKGTEQITYVNNSPDTLRQMNIKLFLNIHKPGASRDYPVGAKYLNSGVTIDQLMIGSTSINVAKSDMVFTNQTVALPTPLPPHDSVNINFNWHYLISLESNREGMIDSTTYFLAYFYPRIAVYDDYSGWDKIPFLDSKEFYSDFNDYEVTVNAPKNYIVWGTGTLQHPEKLLKPDFYHRYTRALSTDSLVRIASPGELKKNIVTTQQPVNDWTFTASGIPDMTFAISNHFNWDASSVVVDSMNHRRASVQAAYNDTAADYHHMVGFARHALNWFSNNWPGIPYPYEKSTIVEGFADMEYPMMVNDGSNTDALFSRFVVEHEIAHTYMPFYMGINETRYGFMDEGWATTFELLIGRADLGKSLAEENYKGFRVNRWINDPSADEDLPIITPGSSLTGRGLGNNEYGKASLGYLAAMDLLGEPLFKKCLQAYMYRWHGKHPIPWDFFNTFSDVSGKNLNWFWKNWYFSNGYIDLAIKKVAKSGSGYRVSIENVGGFAAPFDILVSYSDGSQKTTHCTPAVWQQNEKLANVYLPDGKPVKSIRVDGGIFMDATPLDNVYHFK